jgi:hypothetical protein
MQKVIPEDVLRTFAQTSTYDKLPEFIAEKREYAARLGLGLPQGTPEQRERAQHIIKEVQKVQVSRVPKGLEDLAAVNA